MLGDPPTEDEVPSCGEHGAVGVSETMLSNDGGPIMSTREPGIGNADRPGPVESSWLQLFTRKFRM